MKSDKIEKAARKYCTHKIVFTDPVEKLAVARAIMGRSTKAIADEFQISESQAQYRVTKAQKSLGRYFRAEYRNGTSPLVKALMRASTSACLKLVEQEIAPQFIPLAPPGIARIHEVYPKKS